MKWHMISGDFVWYSSKTKEKVVQYWMNLLEQKKHLIEQTPSEAELTPIESELLQLAKEQKVLVIIDDQSLAQIPGMQKHSSWINGDTV